MKNLNNNDNKNLRLSLGLMLLLRILQQHRTQLQFVGAFQVSVGIAAARPQVGATVEEAMVGVVPSKTRL